MSQPEISIIVPVYNAEKYIERSVSSLRNQTLQNIEIILVDDSSKDSSLEICNKMAMEDSRIKVIHKENEGAGKARNAAFEIATGEYIGFMDADDYVEKEMFETLCNKAKKYNSDLVMSGVLFVGGNMFSEEGKVERKDYFNTDTHFETEEELKKLRMGIVGSTPEDEDDSKYGMSIWKNLFRRKIIEENKITFESEREIFSEDAMFMIDYISHIKKATGIPEAFYRYCRNEDSVSKSYRKDKLEKGIAFVSEVEKNFKSDIEEREYRIYINRFWQAFCRVLCSQEIMYAGSCGIKFRDLRKRLKTICANSLTSRALKEYPLKTLPMKQRIFAYCMKYKLYFTLKILVGLRSR